MLHSSPLSKALIGLGAFSAVAASRSVSVLDGVNKCAPKKVLDAAMEASGDSELGTIRTEAIHTLMQWCETQPEDLGNGENMADRLFAMAVGIADDNKDGEISDDEAAVVDIALNAMFDYLESKGVSTDDASALLNDGDSDAADRVCELLRGVLPDGEDASMDEVDAFAFDAEAQEPLMDSVLDAVYKKRMVIRAGKKVRINKRVSGTVRLSAAQKVAIRKAGMKSRSASARMRRMRSMSKRRKMGL